jgi:hypothetical protein
VIVHDTPSHVSISGPVACRPTATQNDSLTHETSPRTASPLSVGLDITVQAAPSHSSIRTVSAEAPLYAPTAIQNAAPGQATPLKPLSAPGFGVFETDQVGAAAFAAEIGPAVQTADPRINATTKHVERSPARFPARRREHRPRSSKRNLITSPHFPSTHAGHWSMLETATAPTGCEQVVTRRYSAVKRWSQPSWAGARENRENRTYSRIRHQLRAHWLETTPKGRR